MLQWENKSDRPVQTRKIMPKKGINLLSSQGVNTGNKELFLDINWTVVPRARFVRSSGINVGWKLEMALCSHQRSDLLK